MKKIIVILTLFVCGFVYPQQEASNWYFGENAGIQFDIEAGTVTPITDGQLNTFEGCASISDADGNLLFYTSGKTVYNRNHDIMLNGTGLFGDSSSTQSAIIVSKPNDPNIYYIFTVDTPATDGDDFGLNYYEVDMTLDGGLGSVTGSTQLLENCSEKISAVLKDCVTKSLWVIAFANLDGVSPDTNTYFAYEINDTGVSTTPITSTFPLSIVDIRGYLKFSPDGTKMASANMRDGLFLYDFDTETGIVSNQLELFITGTSDKAYGVEFSPSNQFLYIHSSNDFTADSSGSAHTSALTQFDITVPDIQASEYTLDDRELYRGALQLGPDGKIYRALSENYTSGLPFLGVISNPNETGIAANYIHNAISLGNNSFQGLPPFDQSLFNSKIDIIQNGISILNLDLCIGDSYTLVSEDIPGATYTWTLDGNLLAESDFDLFVSNTINGPGHYEVLIEPNNGDCAIEGEAFVTFNEVPIANTPNDIIICDDDNDNSFSFDFTTNITGEVLGSQDPTVFNVRYFTTLEDATNDENEIMMPYDTVSNPQEIFARIENINNTICFETTSFLVTLFDTPTANQIDDIEVCDDALDGDGTNGIVTTNLEDFNTLILGDQNPLFYTITYHSSQNDADLGSNAFPLNYENTDPFLEVIFVRIQNDNNTNCFDTTSFSLIINPAPEAFNTNLFQCDEDGVPDGFTLFNLTEAVDNLTGGIADRSTKFFTSLIDAQNTENEIDGSAFSNWESPQTLYVQVINNTTGCFSIAELLLEVSATNASDAELTTCDDDGTEDGFHSFNLSDANTTVLNGLPADVTIVYYETYDDALLEQNPLANTYTNTTAYSQTIFVRVENDNACYGVNEVILTVFELPNIETQDELLYCLNFFPELVTLTGGVIGDSPSNYFYDWSTGQTTSEIQVNEPGAYTVTVTNTNGCSKVRTITIIPSNIATIESIDVVDATSNNTLTINVSGEGDYEYALDDINGPYQDSNFFQNVEPGFHTVYVRDNNECGIVEEIVSVIGFPKFFTPNGDGVNDTWQVYGIDNAFQINSKIYIFDRYGKFLTQLSPQERGWDGMYNGNHMPSSDYWFHVTLADGRVFNSHFALKR